MNKAHLSDRDENRSQYILRLMEQATYVYEDDYKDNTTFMKRHGGALSAAALGLAGGAAAYYGIKHGIHHGGSGGGSGVRPDVFDMTNHGIKAPTYAPTPSGSGVAPSVMPSAPMQHTSPDAVPSPGARAAEFVAPTRTAGLSGGRAGASQAQRDIQQMAKDSGELTNFPGGSSGKTAQAIPPATPKGPSPVTPVSPGKPKVPDTVVPKAGKTGGSSLNPLNWFRGNATAAPAPAVHHPVPGESGIPHLTPAELGADMGPSPVKAGKIEPLAIPKKPIWTQTPHQKNLGIMPEPGGHGGYRAATR